jgi:hypothetical protein
VAISNQYTPPEDLSKKNISIAFLVSDFFGNNDYHDDRFVKVSLTQNSFKIKKNATTGDNYREFSSQNIPISKCEVGKNFKYYNEDEVEIYNIGRYYCPDWDNLTI